MEDSRRHAGDTAAARLPPPGRRGAMPRRATWAAPRAARGAAVPARPAADNPGMTGARRTPDAGRGEITDALKRGKTTARRADASARVGPRALLALQRDAGNSAVRALL